MVGPSWLTKRDRTGGPDGPRAGLALASGGLSAYERAHRAAVHGTSARRAAQAKGQGQAGAARFRHLGTGHRPARRMGRAFLFFPGPYTPMGDRSEERALGREGVGTC